MKTHIEIWVDGPNRVQLARAIESHIQNLKDICVDSTNTLEMVTSGVGQLSEIIDNNEKMTDMDRAAYGVPATSIPAYSHPDGRSYPLCGCGISLQACAQCNPERASIAPRITGGQV